MTTPKEALEAARKCIWSGGDSLATVAIIDEALASLQGEDAVERVKALAHRFWSIHPSTIAAMNLTREEFYAREMMALLATGLVPDEAAQALTEARAEIERQADTIRLLDERCAQYERRAEQAGRALEVLAPVRDMLILCGELGGMQPGEKMADYLRRLIDEVAGVESLRARVREVVGPFAAVVLPWGDVGSGMMDAKSVRAARQLNEDLK